MSKTRTRKRLLRVAVAGALLVVAAPSAAWAFPLNDEGGQSGARTKEAGCSLDPRLLRMEPQLCNNDTQITTDVKAPEFNPAPATSESTGIEIAIGWWMVAIAVAAGGVAGLIVALRRGPPQALS